MKTGLWRTSKECCGQMRPRLTGLDLMERCMFGKKGENQYLTEQQHQLSSMEEGIISWYGAVWGGMVLES
jgi:hypothetical protein